MQRCIALLNEAGFEICQWAANCPDVIQGLLGEATRIDEQAWLSSDTSEVKTLGVRWCSVPTKRKIINEATTIFDILGWLAPVVITAKIMLQRLWLQHIGWDDQVPSHIA